MAFRGSQSQYITWVRLSAFRLDWCIHRGLDSILKRRTQQHVDTLAAEVALFLVSPIAKECV
jgi:hypothetical protein